jgi:chorismate dehydratase
MYNCGMIFGKIEYLNLLPFHVFMKRFMRSSSAKMSMEYKRGVPTAINHAFHKRRVDAAFISSVGAKKSKRVNLGIVAKKSVQSVLIVPSKKNAKDKDSASSNVLAKVLGLEGEVLIGDKALRYALSHDDFIDLALEWRKRTALPFVFALLCYHKEREIYENIAQEFLKQRIKIPRYILQNASKRTKIEAKDILEYLKLISYEVDASAKRGLAKFYKEAKRVS